MGGACDGCVPAGCPTRRGSACAAAHDDANDAHDDANDARRDGRGLVNDARRGGRGLISAARATRAPIRTDGSTRARAWDDALVRREREQQQRAREQAHAAAVLERQAQAAAAMQQGLRDAGGQLVARMQRLKADVAERCQHVERTARDDVRRVSAGGGGGGP